MATGAPGLEAPATHQLPCSRRAARRFAGTWGLVGRLLHRGIIGVDEALQRIQRSICDQAPVDPVLLDAQLRAADQVPSLYFHLKHNRDAGRLDSKARAATFHAKAFVPPAEIVLARHAHSVAAQRRHVMDGDAAAGWSGEALAALGGSLRGHAADSADGWQPGSLPWCQEARWQPPSLLSAAARGARALCHGTERVPLLRRTAGEAW